MPVQSVVYTKGSLLSDCGTEEKSVFAAHNGDGVEAAPIENSAIICREQSRKSLRGDVIDKDSTE